MDPRKQECLSLYLYGAGWFSRDENTLAIATGGVDTIPHFCLSCPKRVECENEFEKAVRGAEPEAAAAFDARMAEARSRGVPPTLAAAWLGKRNLDPYARAAIENFKRGHADRGTAVGPLTAPRKSGDVS